MLKTTVIIGFLAWKALLQNLVNSLTAGIRTGSVTGNYPQRHQQHSELRSNDIVLIQDRNQWGIMVSGVPPPRGRNRRTIYKTPVSMLHSINKWSTISFSNPKALLAVNELIVVLGYSIIDKSVNLLVNINYLQLQVVLTTRCCSIIQIDRWFMVNGLSVELTVAFFVVTNVIKFSPHIKRVNLGER